MAFRDINPSPLPSGAYFDITAGIGPAYLEGRDRGIQNALVLDSVAKDAESRNLLRELVLKSGTATGPGAPAAPVDNALAALTNSGAPIGGSMENRLLADLAGVNPELAFHAMAAQRDSHAAALADRQRRAQEATRRLQLISQSPNKSLSLRLYAEDPSPDNPLAGLLETLEQRGAINRADGIDDEEAELIIASSLERLAPIAALDSAGPRVQSTQILDDGTIAYLTSDGQLVRTDEKARNPYQITDIGGGRAAVDRMTGEVQMLSTPEQETAAAAERSEAEKLAGTRGQTTAQRWATQIDEGLSAADSLPVIRRGLELLKGGVETGGWDSVRLWASNRLGVTGADEGELSANLGKAVLAQLRSTFGAQFTEREGARLAEIEAGFGKSTAANIRLLEQAMQLVERTAKRGITAARNSGDADAARMIEEAMNMRITYDGGSRNSLPEIALDGNGVPIRQTELDAGDEGRASRFIQEALERDGLSPQEAVARLTELGPNARLVDLGEHVAALARATSNSSGARRTARDFLEERAAGQRGRFLELVGLGDVGEFVSATRKFMTTRHTNAQALYQEAYEAPLDLTTPKLQELLNRPTMRAAVRSAERIIADEGGAVGHVRVMDATARQLADKAGAALRAGAKDKARRFSKMRAELLAEIDAQVPQYAQARSIYSGEAAMRDAVVLGRNLITKPRLDLDAAQSAIEAMGEGELESFQRGVLRGFVDKLEMASSGKDVASDLVDSPRAREILRLAFRDEGGARAADPSGRHGEPVRPHAIGGTRGPSDGGTRANGQPARGRRHCVCARSQRRATGNGHPAQEARGGEGVGRHARGDLAGAVRP